MLDHQALKVFFRGEFVPFGDANISIANTGFLYGLGVFTGMRAHFNEQADSLFIFRPEDHYRRLHRACSLLRYENFLSTYSKDRFMEILLDLLRMNEIKQDIYIRVTNFTDENRITPKLVGYGDSLCAFLYPLGDYIPTNGIRCKVASWTRVEDNAMPARAKICGTYVNTAFAKTEALRLGYDEAIFLNSDGHVVEGSAENIFIVRSGKLITPCVSQNILEGITRDSILQIAANEGIECEERAIARTELYYADEIFLSGTGAKVSPVISVDDYKVGDGSVGPISKSIQSIYARAVRGEDERYMNWVVKV